MKICPQSQSTCLRHLYSCTINNSDENLSCVDGSSVSFSRHFHFKRQLRQILAPRHEFKIHISCLHIRNYYLKQRWQANSTFLTSRPRWPASRSPPRSCSSGRGTRAPRTSGSTWPRDVSTSLLIPYLFSSGLPDAILEADSFGTHPSHLERQEEGSSPSWCASKDCSQLAIAGGQEGLRVGCGSP